MESITKVLTPPKVKENIKLNINIIRINAIQKLHKFSTQPAEPNKEIKIV